MRILHVITTLDIGGAERLMVDLLPLLNNNGNEVELLLFNGLETPFKRELVNKGIHVNQLSYWKGITHHYEVYNPINIIKLRKYLKKYDIIHTHNTACQLYVPLAATLFGVSNKLVTTEHSTVNKRRNLNWFRVVDRWMYSKYSAVVCVSEQTAANIKSYIGDLCGIKTIINGINIDRFLKPIADISKKNDYMISMIAAFRKEKDHETLLRAMALLPDDYKLQLVGQDFENRVPSLKVLCHELGIEDRVLFLGPRSDIPNILENSDIAVLSSHWEGFGLSAVEAMAAGRPLIATDVGGLRDVVKGAGVLFPHGDSKTLAQKIQWLCENPDEYRAVARRCQARAQQYDISIMAQKYSDLYKSLVK